MAPEIEKQICDKFVAEQTITALAKEYEVTYQAIHRVIKKHGLSRASGGKSKAVASRRAKEQADAPATDRQGCSKEQWDLLRAMDEDYKKTPLAVFNTFKNNFQNLKEVAFDLALWDWWQMWEASGRWAQRARNPDGMWVMAQIDSALPLTKDNARIIPFGQLLKETRSVKLAANDEDRVKDAA